MIETLERHVLWQSRWYALRQDRIRDAAGREFTYTVVEHPGSVAVLPVTVDGQIVLIRQYRHPVGCTCYEIPAGSLGPGQTPEEAARRELEEEVGGHAGELTYIGWFYPSNGISSEVAHIFLATGVELGTAHREPSEQIEIQLVSTAEALTMARSGQIVDGRCALALFWCEPILQGLQSPHPNEPD